MLPVRALAAYAAVSLFILYFIFSGFGHRSQRQSLSFSLSSTPDFSRYAERRTLEPHEFPLDDQKRRVILVGDIHGRFPEFQTLLKKLKYSPPQDVLVSAGDIVAKGPLNGSLQVLAFMSSHNITAVRGNHDQKVVEWRTWIEWIHTLPAGKRWLRTVKSRYDQSSKARHFDVKEWLEEERNRDRKRNGSNAKWWDKIPKDWKFFGPHYLIACSMTATDYQYLVERPLIIHVPHAHTYIAHAGVLASNPELQPRDKKQPLARIPSLLVKRRGREKEDALRRIQEVAVLEQVPQNTDPWVTLNMRSILDDKSVTRSGKDGTPWSEVYNKDLSLCQGFDTQSDHGLPCFPSTVIYGHAASRGLDIKRWTIGLDSGCVYDRRLSSLVLGGPYARKQLTDEEFAQEADEETDADSAPYDISGKRLRTTIRFGERGKGKVVTVPC